MTSYILAIIIGYVVGSIPFSYIASKQLGKIDIREHGSGNSGATNVYRVLGRKAGAVAFLGDFVKGLVCAWLGLAIGGSDASVLCAAAGVVGHCYPFTIGFKGGKGVATSAGMIVGTHPLIGLIIAIIQLTTLKVTKIMSLASIVAAVAFPVIAILFNVSNIYLGCAVFLSIFVIFRHRTNVVKLMKGEENTFKL